MTCPPPGQAVTAHLITCSDGGQTNVVSAPLLWFIWVALHQAESCQHRGKRVVS